MEEETPKAKKRSSSSVLGSLREAIAKLQLAAGPAGRRGQHRVAGLLQLKDLQVGEPGHGDHQEPVADQHQQRRGVARGPEEGVVGVVQRPRVAGGGDDDIDQRAELFIANFYRQLRMERQVSLQLRYVRGNSWDRSPAASPSPSPSPSSGSVHR
ncbi:unnamed protein product [Miscanthus lutarioriparius]|uniref:Uncharacterized protein n=1 Tax=Miscanthus lutarioriparius TaxID=422564 RepID=A0A811R5H1_9POAL|nr:unnamed protein product [Miscanthus lutarioriparius]